MSSAISEQKTRSLGEQTHTEGSWLARGVVASVLSLVRPYVPQMVPFMAFAVMIPVLAFFSISAGWIVWRNIAVGWETTLYLQYGDGMNPYAHVQLPPLVSQQPYDISLHLVVPTSASNYELGNFMTVLTLSTPSNKTIASVRRPALVLPTANPLSLIWGQTGVAHLTVPLLTSMEPGTSNLDAHVELGRRDQWTTLGNRESRELSVSSALLRGVVVHQGFRGLLTRFPLLTALTASGTFFFVSFVILAGCLLPMVELGGQTEDEPSEAPAEKPPHPLKREESIPRRSRRSRSAATPRRPRSRSSPEVKTEEPRAEGVPAEEISTTIPRASSSTDSPLRRRRSRLSQSEPN